jgi:hypothetical protein
VRCKDEQIGARLAYFPRMQSNITFSGLPTTTGSAPRPGNFMFPRFVPDNDSFNGAQMEPAPGSRTPPGAAGYVASPFVAMKRQFVFFVRCVNALLSFV